MTEIVSLFCNGTASSNGNDNYSIKENACNEMILEFLILKHNDLILEGYCTVFDDAARNCTRVKFTVNDTTVIYCSVINERCGYGNQRITKGLAIIPFSAVIHNLSSYHLVSIKIELENGAKNVYTPYIRSGSFFPFCMDFQSAYAVLGNWIVRMNNNLLIMEPSSSKTIIEAERKLCKEYMSLHAGEATKAIYFRHFYHCYKAVNKREIWLISDQWYRADDNGEALFTYISKNKSVNQDVFFVLRKDSLDYNRVASYGKVIEPNTFEHRLYRLLADKNCISHVDDTMLSKLFPNGIYKYYQDILNKEKYVFLQHGITQNNVANVLSRFECNFALLTVGGTKERNGFMSGHYFYDDSVVKLTGLARYDYLTDKRNKIILIMPTWRENLADWGSINNDGTAVPADEFYKSDFFLFYNSLLNDAGLIGYIKEHGYKIKFMPHPNIRPFLNQFQKNASVEFCASNTRYRDLFSEGSILLTDYSSVAFDFAYLNKPVIYCQFDKEYFFSKHYRSGYFDYEKDGFGEVTYDVESTIKCIIEYVSNECKLKEQYKNRIIEFFKFNDKNNCKRIYEEILKLESTNGFSYSSVAWATEESFNSICQIAEADLEAPQPYMMTFKYMFPFHLFRHTDKIIIYGAGNVGLEFYHQNKIFHFLEIVGMIDKKYDAINIEGLIVDDIKSLTTKEYDYILVAVLSEKVAKSIRDELIDFGIEEERIKWDGEHYPWLNFYAGGGFDQLLKNIDI